MNWLLRHSISRVMEQAAEGAGGGGGEGASGTAGDQVELERRAASMGWSPKDQWRGDPQHWIDAPEYVRRGEEIIPILRSNLRARDEQVNALEAKLQKQGSLLQAAQESINVLTNLNTKQSRETAKQKRRELLRAQVAARREGNADLEIQLGEQIEDTTAAINRAEATVDDDEVEVQPPTTNKRKKAAAGGGDGDGGRDPVADPAYQSFLRDNSWFGTDKRRTAMATAIGEEIRSDPANNGLQGKAFFDRVAQEVNKFFAPARSTNSRVEGGGAGGGHNGAGGNSNSGKSYSDLPAEAKTACDKQANFIVGEGRAFKDINAWRAHYTKMYFEE